MSELDDRGIHEPRIAVVTDQPLDIAAHERAVLTAAAGAHVLFCGVVRDHDHGKPVRDLYYEAHPTAGDVIVEVARRFSTLPGVEALAVSHRVGQLAIGDVALVAAVSTAHRADAFEICARLVDEVKKALPIWKLQHFSDGTDEWVNST
jgi:molybdopterin synthase catalytic subunit